MTRDPIERFRALRGGLIDRPFLTRLTSFEVIDVAIRGYQALAWTFLRRTVLPALFCVAASLFVAHYFGTLFVTQGHDAAKEASELSVKLVLALGFAMPLFLIGVSWTTSVVTCLASDWILDRVPNGAAASARALQLLPRLTQAVVWETFVGAGGVILGLILLFVSQLIPADSNFDSGIIAALGVVGVMVGCFVAIFVFLTHSLVPAILVVEGGKVRAAGKRSRNLLSTLDERRRNPGQASVSILGLVAFFAAAGTLGAWYEFDSIADISSVLHGLMPGTIVNLLVTSAWALAPVFLIFWLVLPLWSLGTVAIYYASRVRIEGYDIDLLAAEVAKQDKRARFEI